MTRADRALAVAAEVVQLRAALAQKEREFADLVPEDGARPSRRGRLNGAQTDGGGSVPTRILALLNGQPNKIFSLEEMSTAIPGAGPSNVRAAAGRMAREHQIAKVRRGRYRAAATT